MKKQNLINFNQLRLKLLYKSVLTKNLNRVTLSLDLYKLKSFNEDIILENLLLVEFISNLKTAIKRYKKGYQNSNVLLNVTLRKKAIIYYLNILKNFYFPLLHRRSLKNKLLFDSTYNSSFLMKNINEIPFLPEIYFKFENKIKVSFFLYSNSIQKSNLLISYCSGFVSKQRKL
jgi:ribosomal protein L5